MKRLLAAFLFSAFAFSHQGLCEEVRFVSGVNGFYGISDFTVQGWTSIQLPSVNGTHTVKRLTTDRVDLVWDIQDIFEPNGVIPRGAKIESARFGFRLAKSREVTTTLIENPKPASMTVRPSVTSTTPRIRNFDRSTTTSYHVFANITDQVTRMSVGLPMHGVYLAARPEVVGSANIYSSDNTDENLRPQLIVTYDPSQIFIPSGDSDGNGVVNAIDLDYQAMILTGDLPFDPHFDLDKNGEINEQDRLFEITHKAGTVPGDANLDGEFSSADLVLIFQGGQYEDSTEKNSTWSTGDFDGDREFTTSDLVFAYKYGNYRD